MVKTGCFAPSLPSDPMPKERDDSINVRKDAQQGLALLELAALSHAALLKPFIRLGFGWEYPGVPGIQGIPIMILFMAETNDPGMLRFAGLWLVLLLVQRSYGYLRGKKGEPVGAFYDGFPWLASLVLFCRSEERAKNIEPILCLAIGWLLLPISPAIGFCVMGGFVSLGFLRQLERFAERQESATRQNFPRDQRQMQRHLRKLKRGF